MDAAYANKVELQAKVDSMDQEIKFFKCLYEAVSLSLHSAPLSVASGHNPSGAGRRHHGPRSQGGPPVHSFVFISTLRGSSSPSSGWERNGAGLIFMAAGVCLGPRGNELCPESHDLGSDPLR